MDAQDQTMALAGECRLIQYILDRSDVPGPDMFGRCCATLQNAAQTQCEVIAMARANQFEFAAPATIFSRRKAILSEEIQRAERLHSLRNEYIIDLVAAMGQKTYIDYAQIRTETTNLSRFRRHLS
jgi:hypothetical protein